MRSRLLSIVALLAAAGAAGGQEGRTLTNFDFRLSRGPRGLPVAFESLHAAAFGDRLNIVGLDEARRVRRLAVNERGQVVGASIELPIVEVTGMAVCGGALVVTGVNADDHATALGLTDDGRLLWHADMPSAERYKHWPRPVCADGVTWLFSTSGGAHSAMRVVEVTGGRLGAQVLLALPDDSDTIDVLGDAEGALVARVHADGQRLELMRVTGDRVTARVDVHAARPVAPSVALVGDAIALAWVTAPNEPHMQWFDKKLNPVGAPALLPAPSWSAVTGVRLLAALDGRLAVAFRGHQIIGDAATVRNPDGTLTRQEPRRASPLWIAAYDRQVHNIRPPHLVDADAKLYAGAWLGSHLAIAHRGRDTQLSVFARSADQ